MAVLLPGQARPDRVAHPQAWAVQGSRPSPAERRGRKEGTEPQWWSQQAPSLPPPHTSNLQKATPVTSNGGKPSTKARPP